MTHIELRDDIEYIVHCAEDGTVIGPISKIHAHIDGVRETLTHMSTWVMVYHIKSGTYGLQRKNPTKHDKYNAGKWDMGVAGHNSYVDVDGKYIPLDFEETMVKEAQEEIGLVVKAVKDAEGFAQEATRGREDAFGYIYERFHYKISTDSEWVGLGFIVVGSQSVEFVDDEVIDFQWLTPDEVRLFIGSEREVCAAFPIAFEKAEKFRKKYLV